MNRHKIPLVKAFVRVVIFACAQHLAACFRGRVQIDAHLPASLMHKTDGQDNMLELCDLSVWNSFARTCRDVYVERVTMWNVSVILKEVA